MFIYIAVATTSETLEFKIAENYFSDILNAQLVIFSIIVGAIVALYFLFNWKISRDYIKEEAQKESKWLKEEINREFEEKNKQITENFAKELTNHEGEIGLLQGQVYRTLGEFWSSQKNYGVSFIWWIRSAHRFSKFEDETLARIALSSAKETLEKVKDAYELNSDWIGEYQRLFSEIDDKLYNLEKDLLNKAIKAALNRRTNE